MNIHDVEPFYKSQLFSKSGYRVESRLNANGRDQRIIVKTI
jgi:hypothetical protein